MRAAAERVRARRRRRGGGSCSGERYDANDSCKLVVDSVIQFVQEHLLLCLQGCELRHGFLLLMQATGAPKSTTFNRSDAASHALL